MPPIAAKTTLKRINKEIADLQKESLGEILLTADEADIHKWTGWLPGPDNGPYNGGQFELTMVLPADYPFSPPKVQFITPIYHCNVNAQGGICLDILKTNWSPALSLYKVLLSLSALLCDPNPNDPLVGDIAAELRRNKAAHDKKASEHTLLHAGSAANLAKRERFRLSLVMSGKLKEPETKSNDVLKRALPIGPPPVTAQGRPVAGTQRVASSTSVHSSTPISAVIPPASRSSNNSVNTPPVVGARRTAAEVVDMTEDGDENNETTRRVRSKRSTAGGTTEDAIVVD